MKLGDLETICARCVASPNTSGGVPHDGPCGPECDEGLTGCHCVTPEIITNPFRFAVVAVGEESADA